MGDDTVFAAVLAEKFGQFVLQVVARQAVGQFQQDVPFGIQRFGKAAVRGGKLEGEAADEFETAQAFGEMVFDAGNDKYSLISGKLTS